MHATAVDRTETERPGLISRIANWLDFAGATLAMSRAWSLHQRVDADTLRRAGMTQEIQDRVLQFR